MCRGSSDALRTQGFVGRHRWMAHDSIHYELREKGTKHLRVATHHARRGCSFPHSEPTTPLPMPLPPVSVTGPSAFRVTSPEQVGFITNDVWVMIAFERGSLRAFRRGMPDERLSKNKRPGYPGIGTYRRRIAGRGSAAETSSAIFGGRHLEPGCAGRHLHLGRLPPNAFRVATGKFSGRLPRLARPGTTGPVRVAGRSNRKCSTTVWPSNLSESMPVLVEVIPPMSRSHST